MNDYRLVEQIPSVEDYNSVRAAAGLGGRNPHAAEIGLVNSVFGVCVETGGRIVGIGRIIGHSGLFFQVVDVAVLPAHQKKGLGAMIMDALMSWLRKNSPLGAYVQRVAEENTTGFYEEYRFRVRTPDSSGMSFMIL